MAPLNYENSAGKGRRHRTQDTRRKTQDTRENLAPLQGIGRRTQDPGRKGKLSPGGLGGKPLRMGEASVFEVFG